MHPVACCMPSPRVQPVVNDLLSALVTSVSAGHRARGEFATLCSAWERAGRGWEVYVDECQFLHLLSSMHKGSTLIAHMTGLEQESISQALNYLCQLKWAPCLLEMGCPVFDNPCRVNKENIS
uniref:Uncharacterized protein n=1 Tax=Sphaerodactylus townsendi TaxID=933632 RepID=A0ACB8FJG8_9SAUR